MSSPISPPTTTTNASLTRAQKLLWLGQALQPDLPLYNMIHTFRIEGVIDPAPFAAAFRAVLAASDSLRTVMRSDSASGEARPFVMPPAGPEFERMAAVEWIDLSGEADPEKRYQTWVDQRRRETLNPAEKLFDIALLKLAETDYVWYLCQHHMITDGQGFVNLYNEMGRMYSLALVGELKHGSTLPQFSTYAAYEAEQIDTDGWRAAADYWAEKLNAEIPPTDLYGKRGANDQIDPARTDRVIWELGPERSAKLIEIATETDGFASLSVDTSVYTAIATLFLTALHRIGGNDRLRMGTPFHARQTATHKETLGVFLEIGSLQLEIEPDETFPSLGEKVMGELYSGLMNIKPGISSAELNRSYDVLFNFVNTRFGPFAGLPMRTEWHHSGYGDSNHVLRLQVHDFNGSGSYRFLFDLNAALFGEQERRWLLDQFEAVVDAFFADPERPLGSFDLLTDQERAKNVVAFNRTDREYPRDKTVVDLFEAQVATRPDAIAAQRGDQTLTYAELNAHADLLAAQLVEMGVGPEKIVAVCMERSLEVLVAIWGVLKAGGAYLPIDPAYPAERRNYMLADAEPVCVLLSENVELGEGLPYETLPINPVTGDRSPVTSLVKNQPVTGHRLLVTEESLVYLIYTSGSTGRPKGTMLTHQGLMNYVTWAAEVYQGGAVLDFPLYSSLAFDLTVTSIFVPLTSGGRVVVYSEADHPKGLEVLSVFEEDAVDLVKLTPAHLGLVQDVLPSVKRIRHLIVGGEDFKTELARGITESLRPESGELAIFNEYGPTEAVVGCMIHRFDRQQDKKPSVPIGTPAGNARIYLLDRYRQPVPSGVLGEMYISSDGVARGYKNRPELTAERFGDDPFRAGARIYQTGDVARWDADGQLLFLGRRDHQVKIRGARIELGEIEAALLAHPKIETAVIDVVELGRSAPEEITHCTVCGLPSNYPEADLDDEMVCADCRAFAKYKAEVDRYFRTPDDLHLVLDEVKKETRENKYDSLILLSGGKDSTYMLYQCVREFGMRPLAFTLDNGYISPEAIQNVQKACDDLGVDLRVASTPHMNAIFADSLRRKSNVCDGCFKTIYTLSMSLARSLGVSTIITGLARGQLFETRLADTFKARMFDPEQIDSFVMDARKAYHHIHDAVYELLDTELFQNDRVFGEITFVDFYRYIDVDLTEVYRYLTEETVWSRPSDTGRSTNCLINDVGIYIHQKEKGYHNYALPYSWDVRLGHKQRGAAMDELDDDLDLTQIRKILDEVGYDENEKVGQTDQVEKRLAAYYVVDVDAELESGPLSSAELRTWMGEHLPEFMLPSYYMELEEMPLTTNGKVDRPALPDPETGRPELESRYVAPTTERQQALADIWAEVLHIPDVGIQDNFFELGGDSIISIQLVARAKKSGLKLTPRQLFEHQTIEALAPVITDIGTNGATRPALNGSQEGLSAAAAGHQDRFPLTPTQLGILSHTLRAPNSEVYFEQIRADLHGALDPALFKQAWELLVAHYPALRTRFEWATVDEPRQIVLDEIELDWFYIERELTRDHAFRLEDVPDFAREEGFDLSAGVPLSFSLVDMGDYHHFVWNSHHILLDGWSTHMLFDQGLRLYTELSHGRDGAELLAPTRPFSDYVNWLGEQDRDETEAFWREKLAGFETPTPLQIGKPAQSGTEANIRHGEISLKLSPDVTAGLQSLARSERVTLNTLFQGGWALLLSRYSGEEDVLFGTTVSGRPAALEGVEQMVGMFINTLPLRVSVDETAGLADWLRTIQADQLEIRRYEHSSLADIQRWSELPGGQALFESIVVFENYPLPEPEAARQIEVRDLIYREQSNYPLALLVVPGGAEIELLSVYNWDRFEQDEIERLLHHLEQILTGMVAHQNLINPLPMTTLPLLTAAERQQTVVDWNQTGYKNRYDGWTLHALIEGKAQANPAGVAVHCGPDSLTYAELNRQAEQVADRLRGQGIGPAGENRFVGVMAERSVETIVSILAILKAGGAYVPLDPDYPADRIAHIVEDAALSLILTAGSGGPMKAELPAGVELLPLAPILAEPFDGDGERPEATITADDLAYLIYTSGSTGKPKGVMVSHRNIVHSTTIREKFYPHAAETFLLLSSFAFDSSMVGLFWTLTSGGTLLLPEPGMHQDVLYLGEAIERHQVTHLLALPSLYQLLLDETEKERLASLKTVMVAGEACHAGLVARHYATYPQSDLYNEYGPTEGTVWSHAYRFPEEFEGPAVPIGKTAPNVTAYVLDRYNRPVPLGVPGELVLGGAGIAQGYLNRPELTAEKFVTLPEAVTGRANRDDRFYRTGDLVAWREDGNLIFLGRVDQQVKIRGFRIELGEIEATLLDHPAVQTAAVVVYDRRTSQDDQNDQKERAGARSEKRLAGYYVAAAQDEDLRSWLRQRLPGYMVPATLIRLEEMPRLPNGKIDRRALPDPIPFHTEAAAADYVAPSDPREAAMVAVWAEVLRVERVSTQDNFFDLGGDSIIGIQIVARARRAGLHITPAQLFEYQTIAELAQVAQFAARSGHGTAAAEQGPIAGSVGITPIQHWFFEQKFENANIWNQSMWLEIPPESNVQLLTDALQYIPEQHDALRLRARFKFSANSWEQQHEQTGPAQVIIPVTVVDLTDTTSDSERQSRLESSAAGLAAVLDFDSGPIMGVGIFKLAPTQPLRLFVTVHHLVIDGVSWRPLLEDWGSAYQQLVAGEPVRFPAKTTSFKAWSQALTTYAERPEVQSEVDFWQTQLEPAASLPLKQQDRSPSGEARSIQVSLSEEETKSLLREINSVYNTQINDVLLAGLGLAFSVTGESSNDQTPDTDHWSLMLEGHGREEAVDEQADLSRTVGWFTTQYPVRLELPSEAGLGDTLKSVKEQLRAIPNNGIGYGVLRYLSPDSPLQKRPEPPLTFNYLGQMERGLSSIDLFRPVGPLEGTIDPRNHRPHRLGVAAFVQADRFEAIFDYHPAELDDAFVSTLAERYIDTLRALINHCLGKDEQEMTASDFDLVDLDEDSFDNLADLLGS